ncbi:MAG TPA: HK97 gp10 family phage protein [Candidatus Bathyarchaeia archaeon]|nr:HK97 gp10 family phage protein [Candidatus Bathyarchaeia archaeon]
MSVRVETNSPEIEAWLTEVAQKQPEILSAWKIEGSQLVMAEMRGRAPVRKGFLRESITTAYSPDGFIVYPAAPYAAHVEYGTRPHTIFPMRAKVLSWIGPWGNEIFARHVKHPGFPGRFFVRKTLETVKVELIRLYHEIVERVLG